MIRRFISLVVAVLLLGAAACSHPPKQGVVISTMYNRAHYDEYMYCASYDKHSICKLWLTGHDWVPDAWSLKLRDDKHTGWRKVPQSVYDGPCGRLGSMYPDCIT
jgi:hypothetical protein